MNLFNVLSAVGSNLANITEFQTLDQSGEMPKMAQVFILPLLDRVWGAYFSSKQEPCS